MSSLYNPRRSNKPSTPAPTFNKPFTSLPTAHPTQRLNLDACLETRILDLVCPLAKGQRAIIVSPPRSGKTVLLHKVAKTIVQNHPEVHLITLLVMERPEELLDFQEIAGIDLMASTFDEVNKNHVYISQKALDKAKKLAASGKDVVLLLDSLTRLTRACNMLLPSKGKLLSGGLDALALQFPKELFGSARKIKDGGSLTIIATCLSETDSKLDDAILAEFVGTGNAEIYLSRDLADKKLYPAIEVKKSGTRRDELILHPDEKPKVDFLKRSLAQLPTVEALEHLKKKVSGFKTNAEFLMSLKELNFKD